MKRIMILACIYGAHVAQCSVEPEEAARERMQREKLERVKRIMKNHKILIDQQDSVGNTPLIDAVILQNPDVVRTLLECGANPKIKNNHNQSAFDIAREIGDPRIINLLENHISPQSCCGCVAQ